VTSLWQAVRQKNSHRRETGGCFRRTFWGRYCELAFAAAFAAALAAAFWAAFDAALDAAFEAAF
jgi:hypothetical protein